MHSPAYACMSGAETRFEEVGEVSFLFCPTSLLLYTSPSNFQQPMALAKDTEPPVFQTFINKDGKHQLPTQICPDMGLYCILCQDVQKAFPGVDYANIVYPDHTRRPGSWSINMARCTSIER